LKLRILEQIEKKQMTQKSAAELYEISPTVIKNWKRRHPEIEQLVQAGKAKSKRIKSDPLIRVKAALLGFHNLV
jgi:uncharacterized protein YjcR